MEKHYKTIFGFWALAFVLITSQVKGQTAGGANGMVFRFTKQVWLNPTIILAKQSFEQSTNVKLLILPRINGDDTTGSSRIEKAFDKLLSFLVYKDNVQGSIKFYFNPKNPTKPFTFNTSDELFCKFTPLQKDSVETILNKDIVNSSNLSNFTALPFDSIISRASRYCKKILQSKPGLCGENPGNEFMLTKINSAPAKLNFDKGTIAGSTAPNGGVDQKKYAELEQYYNTVLDVADNSNYPLAWKAMAANTSDVIKLKLKKKQSYFDIDKLVFKNANGTETYNVTYPNIASDSVITLGISGKSPGSMTEVVAYYTPTTTPTQTFAIGAFNVQFYEQKTYKVVLVNLGGPTISNTVAIQNTLNEVYGNVFVKWNVEMVTYNLPASVNKSIHVESSGLLSNYMPDMQPIVSYFKDNCSAYKGNEADTYYLLYGCTNDNNMTGYMPRARNTGFIFNTDPRTAAHELGHGAFNLKHIFCSEELGEGNKYQTNNIMDYSNSGNNNQLATYKYQWDLIHDPNSVGWFEGDDDEGSLQENQNYFTPAGLPFHSAQTAITTISTNDIASGAKLNGVVYGFETEGTEYTADIRNNKFYGYITVGTTTPYFDVTNFTAGQKIDVISYNYTGNCQLQKYKRSYTCATNITSNIYSNGVPVLGSFNAADGSPLGEATTITGCGTSSSGNPLGETFTHVRKNDDHPVVLRTINFANLTCNTFALGNGDIASFTSAQQANISKIGLSSDGELIAFETTNGKTYYSTYGIKLTSGGAIEKTFSTAYFTCFDCLESDINLLGVGSNSIIRSQVEGKILYANLVANNSYYIKLDQSKIEPLSPEKQVMSFQSNAFTCTDASLTKEYIENAIWNCSMTSTCLSPYIKYLDKELLKEFGSNTRMRILDFLFTNSFVEHPGGTEPYSFLTYKNSAGTYVLLELMEAMKEKGSEMNSFVDGYLLSRKGSQPINLQNLMQGTSNTELRVLAVSKISAFITSSGKTYDSPKTSVAAPDGSSLEIPNNMNNVVIYYENMVQGSNDFVISTTKNKVKIIADEFDYDFSGSNIRIMQEGDFEFYKLTGALTPENLVSQTHYNDNYLVHPYSLIPVTFGKAFNELQIPLGQKGEMPACMGMLLAQLGKEKASQQNFMIVGGTVAVVLSVFTGGATLAAFGTAGVTFGGVTTAVVSFASAGTNAYATYLDATEGETTLNPAEYQSYLKVKKIAAYVSLVEGGVGLLSLLKSSCSEIAALKALTNTASNLSGIVSPFLTKIFSCIPLRQMTNATVFSLLLSTASVDGALLKTIQSGSNITKEVTMFESFNSIKASTNLNTYLSKTVGEIESVVSSGNGYKISNANMSTFKVSTPTLGNINSNSTIIDQAFASQAINGDFYVLQFQSYNILYQVSNNVVKKALGYDNLGNTYVKDDGGNPNACTTCTTYSNNAVCMQFTTLTNNLAPTEAGLATKLCKDRLMATLPALQSANVQTVLNYFNAPSPDAATTRKKWYYDLNQGTSNDYLGRNINQIDGDLLQAWNLMNEAKSPGVTSTSALRYDFQSLLKIKNILNNASVLNTLGGNAGIGKILSANIRPRCKTCGNSGASFLKNMDDYLTDVEDFAGTYNTKPGFANVLADLKLKNGTGSSIAYNTRMEAAAYMIGVLKKRKTLYSGVVSSFEGSIDDQLNGCAYDIKLTINGSDTYLEFKSYEANSLSSFLAPSGSTYQQFTTYIGKINNINQLIYYFDIGKITDITLPRNRMKTVLSTNAGSIIGMMSQDLKNSISLDPNATTFTNAQLDLIVNTVVKLD